MKVLLATFTVSCAFLLLAVGMNTVGVEAADPPKGKRKKSEVEKLKAEQKHTLHEAIEGVIDIPAQFFNTYMHPKKHNHRGRYWLVAFYATWCHVCDDLIDPLTKVAAAIHKDEAYAHHKKKLSIGKHDVTADEGVAHKYKVEGYPTILFYDIADIDRVTKFEGKVTYESLVAFINSHTNGEIALPSTSSQSSPGAL